MCTTTSSTPIAADADASAAPNEWCPRVPCSAVRTIEASSAPMADHAVNRPAGPASATTRMVFGSPPGRLGSVTSSADTLTLGDYAVAGRCRPVRRRLGHILDHDVEVYLLRDDNAWPRLLTVRRGELAREPRVRLPVRDDHELVSRVRDRLVEEGGVEDRECSPVRAVEDDVVQASAQALDDCRRCALRAWRRAATQQLRRSGRAGQGEQPRNRHQIRSIGPRRRTTDHGQVANWCATRSSRPRSRRAPGRRGRS